MKGDFVKIERVEGLEQVNANLTRLAHMGRKLKHISKIKALRAGGKVLTDSVKQLAPTRSKGSKISLSRKAKRLGKKYKRLKDSIGTKFATGTSRTALNLRVLVYKPTGHLLEFGHKTKQGKRYKLRTMRTFHRTRGGKTFVAARKFMEPAVDRTQERVVGRIAEVLGNEIAKLIVSR